ncbi:MULTISPECIES: hypothetical protein [Jannaschia]|uniref:hypothetical protein n=1 Tax=Jannaschia TaxID=188905 RepID=UPI001C7E08D0|nr:MULTISPECIES: hypothetical protein [unclassified Jannaschia]
MLLQIHGFASLLPHADGASSRPVIADLLDRASEDLRSLGVQPGRSPQPLSVRPHPVAIDYIVLGSRLGTKVLKRRWLAATDAQVRGAGTYFAAPDAATQWRAFCERTAGMAAHDPDADQIVNDANAIFRHYQACARHVNSTWGAYA